VCLCAKSNADMLASAASPKSSGASCEGYGSWSAADGRTLHANAQRTLLTQLLLPVIGNSGQTGRFFDLLANSDRAAFFIPTPLASMPPKRQFDAIVIASCDLFAHQYCPPLATILRHFLVATHTCHVYICAVGTEDARASVIQFDRIMHVNSGTSSAQTIDDNLHILIYNSEKRAWSRNIRRHGNLITTVSGIAPGIVDPYSMAVHVACQLAVQNVLLLGNTLRILYSAISLCGRELADTFNVPRRTIHCCLSAGSAASPEDKLLMNFKAPYMYCDVTRLCQHMRNRLYSCTYGNNDRDALFLFCLLATASGITNATTFQPKHSGNCRRTVAISPHAHLISGLDGLCKDCPFHGHMPMYIGTTTWATGNRIPHLNPQNIIQMLHIPISRCTQSALTLLRTRLSRLLWIVYFFLNSYSGLVISIPNDIVIK
jgi:hypothetical protein